jgi:thiol-disulfide isomerase/thioredoxin
MVKLLLALVLLPLTSIQLEHHTGVKQTLHEVAATKTATLVSFWAVWCDACKKELVALDQSPDWAGVATDQRFQLVLVNLDPDSKVAVDWVQKNLKNPVFLKNLYVDRDADLPETMGADSMPASILVGGDGTVVKSYRRFEPAELITDIRTKLGAMR